MAITQARMMELLRIAESLKSQLFHTKDFIDELCKELSKNPTRDELLVFVQAMQNFASHITIGPKALETLAIENAHFKLNAQRNARQALKQRIKRGKDPEAIPQPTAPQSMRAKLSETKYAPILAELKPLQKPIQSQVQIALNETLVNQKLEINRLYREFEQPEPYPDWANDEEPLQDEHKRHFGLEVEGDEGPF